MTILQGAPNFRDIGGSLTRSGQAILHGRVFRSQRLAGLSPEDRRWLDGAGIATVLDLRAPADLARRPNEWPVDRALRTIVLEAGAHAEAASPRYWRSRLDDPAFGPAEARDEMMGLYKVLPRLFAPHVKALYDCLAQDDSGPVLIHCEAGKDRTGFVCAVLMLSLGVPKEAVFDDYLLSAQRYARSPGGHAGQYMPKEAMSERAKAALHEAMTVYPSYLETALAEIDQTHGSLDAYLRHAGVDGELQERARQQLLSAV